METGGFSCSEGCDACLPFTVIHPQSGELTRRLVQERWLCTQMKFKMYILHQKPQSISWHSFVFSRTRIRVWAQNRLPWLRCIVPSVSPGKYWTSFPVNNSQLLCHSSLKCHVNYSTERSEKMSTCCSERGINCGCQNTLILSFTDEIAFYISSPIS
jgi:hypothetical protein